MASFYPIHSTERKISTEIIECINSLPTKGKRYAAFDLDNTLLIGDIGETVFALLVKKKLIKGFGWQDYINLVESDKLKAYKLIIDLMAGLPLTKLEEVTNEVIAYKSLSISIEGCKLQVPKPNPLMKSVLGLLRNKGLRIYIVTASNEVSARIICKKYFNIPPSDIIGAQVARNKKEIIKIGKKEFPFGEGKVTILKKRFKTKPLVTGGDSPGDRFLLNYTQKSGIQFWLGKDEYHST